MTLRTSSRDCESIRTRARPAGHLQSMVRSRKRMALAGGEAAARALRLFAWFGVALAALVCVLPVAILIIGSFSEGNPFNDFHPSIDPWMRALDSSQTLRSIGYSFLLSLRVPLALMVAFIFAWYLARNDVFGKRTIVYALWLAFFLPILPATLGWILLGCFSLWHLFRDVLGGRRWEVVLSCLRFRRLLRDVLSGWPWEGVLRRHSLRRLLPDFLRGQRW